MLLRTVLLISDDPDDHVQFTEVTNEIAADVAVVAILDSRKASHFLSAKPFIPDLIIVNLSMNELDGELFRRINTDGELTNTPLLVYGEFSEFAGVPSKRVSAFLENDFTYSRLRTLMQKILNR